MAFFYSLAGGMMIVLATGQPRQIAWRFLRLAVLIVFALLCGLLAWDCVLDRLESRSHVVPGSGSAWSFWLACGAAITACMSFLLAPLADGNTFRGGPAIFRSLLVLGGLLALTAAGLTMADVAHPSGAQMWLIVTAQMLGAILIGSITVAWLLGHAYLTATKMTIAPLRHFSRVLSWAVIARTAFVVLSLAAAWRLDRTTGAAVLPLLRGAWLVVTLRVVLGLFAVGVFAYMVADCVRLRSTQAATGILYFGSICAYIGELASQHLTIEYGWPL